MDGLEAAVVELERAAMDYVVALREHTGILKVEVAEMDALIASKPAGYVWPPFPPRPVREEGPQMEKGDRGIETGNGDAARTGVGRDRGAGVGTDGGGGALSGRDRRD